MLYYANPSTQRVRDAMTAGHLRAIMTPKQGNRLPDGVRWCADNGRYGKGWPGEAAWLAWLDSFDAEQRARCDFAVAPDVVGDAAATLTRALPWLPRIRALGYPAAYVAQDGADKHPPPWDDLDVLFIGGSTDWKLGPIARALVAQARSLGKGVHMGRVNSERRYRYAAAIGCDSADGTYLTFGPDLLLPNVLSWLRSTDQPSLITEASA